MWEASFFGDEAVGSEIEIGDCENDLYGGDHNVTEAVFISNLILKQKLFFQVETWQPYWASS